MIHLVTDLLDPALGSEFQVALKALHGLMRHASVPVHLWTCRRAGNEARIGIWLERHGYASRVRLSCVDMPRADVRGDHRRRVDLLLDLACLYRAVRAAVRPEDRVWKCGQPNFVFALWFLAHGHADAIGPIAGFERPPWRAVRHLPSSMAARYLAYGLAAAAGGAAFRWLQGRRPALWLLPATAEDAVALGAAPEATPAAVDARRVLRWSEVSIDDLVPEDAGPPRVGGVPSAGPRLVWSGALIHRKNPLLALEVLARLLDETPGACATMIGSGPLQPKLQRAWAALPERVRLRLRLEPLRPRAEFLHLLADAHVLLVTSLREVNSVLVHEAFARGLVVVSTAVSGMRESVGACGELYASQGADVVDRAVQALRCACAAGPRRDPVAWLQEQQAHDDAVVRWLVQGWRA